MLDFAKNSTWNLYHAYIDAHIQIIIDECTGYGVQDVSILKLQCAFTIFSDQSRYNIIYQKVVH